MVVVLQCFALVWRQPRWQVAQDGVEVCQGGTAGGVEPDIIIEVVEEGLKKGLSEGWPAKTELTLVLEGLSRQVGQDVPVDNTRHQRRRVSSKVF